MPAIQPGFRILGLCNSSLEDLQSLILRNLWFLMGYTELGWKKKLPYMGGRITNVKLSFVFFKVLGIVSSFLIPA